MTDKNTHAILFELQKNLEDLASAKVQMEEFRSSATSVVQGIGNVQDKFVAYLTDLEIDYKQRVNKLEESLTSFLLSIKEENNNTIQTVVSVSEKEIIKGVEQFSIIASKVESSNDERILEITKLLETLELDYQLKLRQLQESIGSFISSQKEDNKSTMLEVASTTKDAVSKGVDKFSVVADNVETSNNEKILVITKLLEHYKSVVEASRSVIDTLKAIDFPSKLDALSSKTQLIIESITNAKQALELKSNETQTSIIDKTTTAKEQIIESVNNTRQSMELKSKEAQTSIIEKTTTAKEQINQNTDSKFQSLTEQVNSTKADLNKTFSDNFNEQKTQYKVGFEKLNNSIITYIEQVKLRQEKQDIQLQIIKYLGIGITIISVLGIVTIIYVLKNP